MSTRRAAIFARTVIISEATLPMFQRGWGRTTIIRINYLQLMVFYSGVLYRIGRETSVTVRSKHQTEHCSLGLRGPVASQVGV